MGNVNLTSVGGNTIRHTPVHGQKTVDAAGTAEALGAAQAVSAVTVKALADNTGNIYVGGSTVDSTNGYVLAAGEAVLVMADDISSVYIDSGTNDDGVSFIAT